MCEKHFEKEGQVGNQIGMVIQLIIGVGVAALVLIFVGTMGGQTYEMVQGDICDLNTGGLGEEGCTDGIADYNIAGSVRNGIVSGFEALETSGDYLPLIVLAVVISIVLALVLGMGNVTQNYGGAL